MLDLLPSTFGAMLDLAAQVLAVLPEARREPPSGLRMAAFGIYLKAFDLARGTETVETYRRLRIDVTESALEADALWPHLVAFVSERQGMIEMSASEIQEALLDRLRGAEEHRDLLRRSEGRSGALRSASATGSWLSRLAGSARPLGWTFSKGHSSTRRWTLVEPGTAR